MPSRTPLILASLFVMVACSTESRPARAGSDAPPSVAAKHAAPRVLVPPAPSVVLNEIFQDPGDGTASYEVGNGSQATFWFGHQYMVDGDAYYTGFVEQSPDHLSAGEPADAPPSATATLTQGSFKARTSGDDWSFVGAQRSIGEVGARGRADAVDQARAAITHYIAPGSFLLAVPTNAAIEQGTVQKNYELLLRKRDGGWSHAGTLAAGLDDSAGCDAGRVFPCAPVIGRLTFERADSAMPSIRVTLSPGSAAAPSAQIVDYRYDAESASYTSSDME